MREINRAERAAAEHERMLRRFPSECGKVKTTKLTKEQVAKYYPGIQFTPQNREAIPNQITKQ